jgi:hypothetical protein
MSHRLAGAEVAADIQLRSSVSQLVGQQLTGLAVST